MLARMLVEHHISHDYPWVYFQGYTHPREYIVTEWPVVSTCRYIVIVNTVIGAYRPFSSQFHSGGLEQLTEFDVFSKRVWNIKLFTVPWIVCFKSKQVVGLPPPHHHPPVYHDNVQTCPTATHTTPNCQNYRHQKFSWQKWDNFSLSNLNFNSEDYLLL